MTDPRQDVTVFADAVLRRPLWAHQIEAAKADRFITAIAAARRTGKTTLAETLAMWTAFRERNVRVLILSATQDAARRLTESIGATLASRSITRGAVVDDYVTRIRLTNGSEIISLPASQRQVRGYGVGVRLVILDEAGFMPSELWTAAHYTALDERPRSRVLMLGTPWGGTDHFFRQAFEAGQDGHQDHASFHWTYEVNPNLDRAYLERQRERVSPAEYAAEVLGEWSDAVGSLFPRDLLDRQSADIEVPALLALAPPAAPIIGLDWGVSFDHSAAAVVYRLPIHNLNEGHQDRAVFIAFPYVWPQKTPLGNVVDDVVGMRAPLRFIATETSGVGAMPSQELASRMRGKRGPRREWLYVATTNQKKTAGYGAILGLLEQRQLVLPRHPDLLRQLAGLRFEQGERGFTRIEADNPATHDDVADALMLAALPYVPRRKARVHSYLAMLANPRYAIEEARVPALEIDVVQTGGGLHVYRRPPLQSVAGVELTLPTGADEREPPRKYSALREHVRAAMENPTKEVRRVRER